MLLPYDEKLGVHPQSDGFTQHEVWDFAGTPPRNYPLLNHYPYFDLYRKQVVKQADLVLAMQLRTEAFTAEQKVRNFVYYEALTVRDSSLSASAQAVLAAETGHLDLAHDYLAESALMDLADLEHNTKDGLHLAALAGAWMGLVAGFGGMRCRVGALPTFAPRLPPALTRLTFAVMLRGRRLRIRVLPGEAGYMLDEEDEGPPLVIQHYGQPVSVTGAEPQTRPIPDQPIRERPAQPASRAPERRDLERVRRGPPRNRTRASRKPAASSG